MSTSSKLDNVVYELAAREAVWPQLPMVIVDDATNNVVFCSPAAGIQLGRTPDRVLDRPMPVHGWLCVLRYCVHALDRTLTCMLVAKDPSTVTGGDSGRMPV